MSGGAQTRVARAASELMRLLEIERDVVACTDARLI